MDTSLSHWTILKPTNIELASEAVSRYTDGEALYLLFENGTALILKPEMERDEVINGAMGELEFKKDFKVVPMQDGNFTVWLAQPVCVFISAKEAQDIIAYVRSNEEKRIACGIQDKPMPSDMIIGIAGREKAHRDAKSKKQIYRFEPNA
jgi:hypothetical protein